jgi:anti-anti-sigma factor
MDDKSGVAISSEGAVAAVSFMATSISDSKGITAASKRVKEFIEENHPRGLVFDFANVKFFSSQILGVLLNVRAELRSCGGEVVISSIEPRLHRIFTITNLDKVFRFFPSREEAVKAISGK